jgi:uncharacterized membrane protein YdbT with pleckstrin-like domain
MRTPARVLLALSALCLAAGGVVHSMAYPKAAVVVDHSTLAAFFAAAFKGLWLCDSANSLWLAIVLGAIAAWPRVAARALVVILGLGPVANALAIYATMGNFFAGYLMLLSGVLALLGGALPRKQATTPALAQVVT